MDKSKNRFSSLDLYGIVKELKDSSLLEGSFLHNIYDCPLSGNSGYGNEAHDRAFIFRFTKQSSRTNLIIHPGVRVNITKYERSSTTSTSDTPSHFVSKLRRHLRDRRLLSIDQLGHDRILRLSFSGHDGGLSLWIEFFGKGNLILTTSIPDLSILCLARENPFTTGMIYPSMNYNSLPTERPPYFSTNSNFPKSPKECKNFLRNEIPCLSPEIIDHIILSLGNEISPLNLEKCLSCHFEEMKSLSPRIYYKNLSPIWPSPISLLQFNGDGYGGTHNPNLGKINFNECVDEYWRGLEEIAIEKKNENLSTALERKMNQVRIEQQERLVSLELKAEEESKMALLLEEKVIEVGKIIEIFKECLNNEMDWEEISSLISLERDNGNPLALMISPIVSWKNGEVDLLLSSSNNSNKIETKTKTLINIFKTPFANAGFHWKKREECLAKLGRTRDAFDMAIKASQSKALRQQRLRSSGSGQQQQRSIGVCKRKGMWMEKFSWFISSDSFIVVGGNDAQQNEYLVKRVLRKGDVYLHADISGASSVIIKNHTYSSTKSGDGGGGVSSSLTIPQRTLHEAGTFSLCKSKAWDAKIVTSAWWVHSEQVSKSAMSGEYLPCGSFMIRGKKNFLAPMPLVLGFGIMFLVPKEIAIRRKKEREEREKERLCGDGSNDSIVEEINLDKYQLIAEDDVICKGQEKGGDEFYVGADIVTKNSNKTQKSIQQQTHTPQHQLTPLKTKGASGDVRGKMGKLKKIKKKYANQDEEDKEIMMSLLQSSCPKPSLSEEEKEKESKVYINQKRTTALPNLPDSSKDDELISEIEGLEINPIDSLIGNPNLENLQILQDLTNVPTYAIPVCGPYTALSNYFSRIKLLPGNLKRGTATKLTMGLIQGEIKKKKCEPGLEEGLNNHLLFLIRNIPDSLLNITMPSKVRIGTSQKEQQVIRRKIGKEGRRK